MVSLISVLALLVLLGLCCLMLAGARGPLVAALLSGPALVRQVPAAAGR
jgi:hypothetical protein